MRLTSAFIGLAVAFTGVIAAPTPSVREFATFFIVLILMKCSYNSLSQFLLALCQFLRALRQFLRVQFLRALRLFLARRSLSHQDRCPSHLVQSQFPQALRLSHLARSQFLPVARLLASLRDCPVVLPRGPPAVPLQVSQPGSHLDSQLRSHLGSQLHSHPDSQPRSRLGSLPPAVPRSQQR